jgi:hypothetical protein
VIAALEEARTGEGHVLTVSMTDYQVRGATSVRRSIGIEAPSTHE